MLILNPIQDLHPSDTYTKKMKSDENNSSYLQDTDGWMDEQGESSITPLNFFVVLWTETLNRPNSRSKSVIVFMKFQSATGSTKINTEAL